MFKINYQYTNDKLTSPLSDSFIRRMNKDKENITFDEAVQVIKNKRKNVLWEKNDAKVMYTILKGPYGNYIDINDNNIIGILDVFDTSGNQWYEVDNLAQDAILILLLIQPQMILIFLLTQILLIY